MPLFDCLLFEVYTQAIMFNSSTNLLQPYFVPLSSCLKAKCDNIYAREQSLKHATRLESIDREDQEADLMKVILLFAASVDLHQRLDRTTKFSSVMSTRSVPC